MKGIALQIILFLAGLFVSFLFYISFTFGDATDYVVARSISKYPNAQRWEVLANSGFPDGKPSGTVYFLTNDVPQVVFDFYWNELSKNGWVRKHGNNTYITEYQFIKRIGSNEYRIFIRDRDRLYRKDTSNWWNWYIYIDHLDTGHDQ